MSDGKLWYDSSKLPCSNVAQTLKLVGQQLIEQYGKENGNFLVTGKYTERIIPAEPKTEGLSSLGKKNAEAGYLDDMKVYRKETRESAVVMTRIHAKLMLLIATDSESLQRCELDDEWMDVSTSSDPLRLSMLMRRQLSTTSAGATPAARKSFRTAYVIFRQGAKTLAQYRDSFEDLIAQGAAIGVTDLRPEDLTITFVEGLNPKYGTLVASLANAMRLGDNKYPDDWRAVVKLASGWVERPQVGSTASHSALLSLQEEDVDEIALATSVARMPRAPAKGIVKPRLPEKVIGKKKIWHSPANPNPHTAGIIYDTTNPEERNKARRNGHCLSCGKPGHTVHDCSDHTTGGIALAVRTERLDVRIEEISVETTCALGGAVIHESKIGGDSLSSCHIISNFTLLRNVHITGLRVRIWGISGSVTLDQMGTLPGVGEVYYWPGGNVNLVSYGLLLRDGAKRTLDGDNDVFTLRDGTVMVFRRVVKLTAEDRQVDVYLHDTRERNEPHDASEQHEQSLAIHSGTVEENKRLYTRKQVEDAEEAVRIYRNMGTPGAQLFKDILRRGTIRGVTVSGEDFDRGISIGGRPLEVIRGKTKNSKVRAARPMPICRTIDKLQVMRIDILFIDGLMFLLSVTAPLYLVMVNHIVRKTAAVVYAALRSFMAAYASAGFIISDIVCDGEGAISKIRTELELQGTRVHVAGKGTHVPEAEERVRTIKEIVRGRLATLPFKLPYGLLIWIVYWAVSRRNMVPHSGGKHFGPPIEIYRERQVDLDSDLPVQFGAPCEVFDGSDNTMAPRTRLGVFLNTVGTESGTSYFLMLDTGRIAKSDRYEERPPDAAFIAEMNRRAAAGKTVGLDPKMHLNDVVVNCGDELPGVTQQPMREWRERTNDYDPPHDAQLIAADTEEPPGEPQPSTSERRDGVNDFDPSQQAQRAEGIGESTGASEALDDTDLVTMNTDDSVRAAATEKQLLMQASRVVPEESWTDPGENRGVRQHPPEVAGETLSASRSVGKSFTPSHKKIT